MADLNLKPRAVAILIALRQGCRTTGQLADAIGDRYAVHTASLLENLAALNLVVFTGRFYLLAMDGIGWLQLHGEDASEDAKRQLYDLLDSKS